MAQVNCFADALMLLAQDTAYELGRWVGRGLGILLLVLIVVAIAKKSRK